MLPSLLAREIQLSLKQFLITGFEPSDPLFGGIMRRFTEDEARWLKGPYLQVGLPFRPGEEGKGFFGHFELEYPGYTHQEAAWQRLASNREAANTLVATGTGSGKTECFLYPVLDHCARANSEGQGGIKALVIYPMNALAADQARRFAEVVAQTPAFKGLRVGLFVGGRIGKPGSGMVMGATEVITDRETLRKDPPDVLLTNYKMLDYLLIRPKDRKLWDKNTPTTLRYVVVDELHTFDGAQGTDLALLLRRLRARLQTPEGHLICVGTSATLGGGLNTAPLREYARQVFGAGFPPEAVITENRLSEAEFLGDSAIEHVLHPRSDFAERLDPEAYADAETVVSAWFELFFPGHRLPANVADRAWRGKLGGLLKKHLLFVNLLKILRGRIMDMAELQQQMQGPLPESARPHIRAVLDALLSLVAWARDPDAPGRPLVTLRVQVWMRELRRMVAKVSADPAQIELRHSKELKVEPGSLYLPLIQCAECHTTGWLARVANGQGRLRTNLDEIYNTWFAGQPEALRLYAREGLSRPLCEGVEQRLCAACGNLQTGDGACHACGYEELVDVFRVTASRNSTTTEGVTHAWHDPTCPACGSRDRLILLGARNATLGSVVVEQSWASPFNDDKKLIAFSDAVQDAAHRAGFFSARTYANTVRTGLANVIDHIAKPVCPWPEFLEQAAHLWLQPGSSLAMPVERFIAEFIGPNMMWQHDWLELQLLDALPSGSRLPERVQKRLMWQAFAEFTYQSRRGRNLDRIGKATLAPNLETLDTAASALLPRLREEFGLRHVDANTVFQWLWGFICHLRQRGAVWHPELAAYIKDANVYAFTHSQGRHEWLPGMGERTPRPIFLSLGQHRGFDALVKSTGPTFYQTWLMATLGAEGLLPARAEIPLYEAAIDALEAKDLLLRIESAQGAVLGLNPAALCLQTEVVCLESGQGKRRLTVPQEVAEKLLGMACLDAPQQRYCTIKPAGGWLAQRFSQGDLRRVFSAEHTSLLQRGQREELERRFKLNKPPPWYENLLSATPTLEMGVDIGALSSVLLCSVPPNQASYMQRTGRAGRHDGNALTTTLADGNSPHDLYFFADTMEMLAGEVMPPGIFLKAAEVLRRQLFAFCLDGWVGSGVPDTALPDKTSAALDARDSLDQTRFPYTFLGFVQQHQDRLLADFLALLGDDLDLRVEERLTAYLLGHADDDSLRLRLYKLLEELANERRVHKKRADQIKSQIKSLKAKPTDEAVLAEIDQLDRERQKLLELVKEINQRDLLNTLTDAGLIPNYAFPEAGIELKSLLWRKRGSDDTGGRGGYVSLPTERYERPAHSALSEFAPENVFYANQHRVEIDQINLNLSKLETWRLCPACQHMENLALQADAHPACPQCGDPMWSNISQKRQLLRFKQAIANSNDVDTRIDDSADDREPRFYLRQLLVDFEPSSVVEAYRLKAQDLPFGFEFIAKAQFRDVNFGEAAKPGETYRVADQDKPRPGFKLCKHCGQIQRAPRNKREREMGQFHAFDCEKRGSNGPENLLECLYLYREFSSEALRILVPYTRSGVDEEAVQSFMAALQLGLKQRFGGRVDHLRLTTQEELGKDGAPNKQYVLLYDSVPGGTGYLHELLKNQAATLVEVFRLALAQLSGCACNADPEKDGCYRCVYQYRLGRAMEKVSRNRARDIFEHLASALDQLEKVDTIADIYINPNFDSELEARFVESLRRLGGQHGLPFVKLVQDIVHGKSGYLVEVAEQRYWLEPQVDLGLNEGVKVACCPDFVLWPAQSQSKRRPIAVFCDGWAYHQDKTLEDSRKRSALVASGRFWVWSVTWQDVKAALDGAADSELAVVLAEMSYLGIDKLPPSLRNQLDESVFNRHAVAILIEWLGKSVGNDTDAYALKLARSAGALAFRMVPHPSDPALAAARAELEQFWSAIPDIAETRPVKTVVCGNAWPHPTKLRYWWPAALADASTPPLRSPGFMLYDETFAQDGPGRHLAWRHWLWLFNIYQTLPGLLLATTLGLENKGYADLVAEMPEQPATSAQGAAHAAAWDEIIERAMASLHQDLRQLQAEGFPPPDEVGFELPENGDVIAEAELAWIQKQLVVLLPHQAEYQPIWSAKGWYVVKVGQGWLTALFAAMQIGD